MTIYYKDKSLPNRIKKCRLETNLSQSQLCSLLGFTGKKETISYYEHNKRIPNVKTLIKMSNIFNVSLDYLLCLDEYKNHLDYISNVLGLDSESVDMLIYISKNNVQKNIINNLIINFYNKEIEK